MDPVSVLFVDYYKEYGGGQVSLLGILKNLDRQRWTPSLVVNLEGRLAEQARELGLQVQVIPMGKGKWRYFWRAWPAYCSLRDFARAQGAKIIHANGFFAATLAGPVAWRLGAKAFWHKRIHVDKKRGSSTAMRWRFYSRFQDRLLAVSAAVGRDLVRLGIPEHKIRVIPNFVDASFLEKAKALPAKKMKELGIPEKTPLVGVIAARRFHKGLDLFLKAAALVRQDWRGSGPAPEFVMIGSVASGEGDYEKKLERLAKARSLKGHVHRIEFTENVGNWYKSLDLVVCPSRREGFGRVVVEAMMAGCAVAASYPEAVEIIEHGRTGLLSAPAYADELAKIIQLGLRDQEGTRARIAAAKKDAAERFGVKRYMKELEEIYAEVL